jgi:hypothetical protein
MKAFDLNRFMNVARWDLTVNGKFYTRSALLMVAIICMPVVLYYLYNMLTDNSFFATETVDDVFFFCVFDIFLGGAYFVITSGYMFHNLITKQGRINELTLPATNLERFLWHVVVIVIGVNVVYTAGILFSDLLHALFRLALPNAEINSISYKLFVDFGELRGTGIFRYENFGMLLFLGILGACYIRTYCLVNAWKYKYNIPWTLLFYFVFQNAFVLLVLFIGHCMSPALMMKLWDWVGCVPRTVFFVSLNLFAVLLYAGVWYLTYRLYCRAQITTRRNP